MDADSGRAKDAVGERTGAFTQLGLVGKLSKLWRLSTSPSLQSDLFSETDFKLALLSGHLLNLVGSGAPETKAITTRLVLLTTLGV